MKSLLAVALIVTAGAVSASEYNPLYRDLPPLQVGGGLSTEIGSHLNGGAASPGTATYLFADDLQLAAGSVGQKVHQMWFGVMNANTTLVTVRLGIRVWSDNGSNEGPGTLLAAYTFGNLAMSTGSTYFFTGELPTLWTVPASERVWAGLSYDSVGTATTAAQLNQLGQMVVNDPDIGSSSDVVFKTNAPGLFAQSNPAGAILQSPLSGAHANFGWQIDTVTSVPEPPLLFALALGLGLLRKHPPQVRFAKV